MPEIQICEWGLAEPAGGGAKWVDPPCCDSPPDPGMASLKETQSNKVRLAGSTWPMHVQHGEAKSYLAS